MCEFYFCEARYPRSFASIKPSQFYLNSTNNVFNATTFHNSWKARGAVVLFSLRLNCDATLSIK